MTSNIAASRPLLAAGCITLGMASVAFVDQFISILKSEASVWQFLFLRGLMMLAMLIAFAWMRNLSLRSQNVGAVLFRSITMSLGLVVYFGALGFVSVATAAAGLFTSPIFVLLISALFLGQKVGVWRVGAVALGFFGVVFALTPGSEVLFYNPVEAWQAFAAPSDGGAGWVRYVPAIGGLFYGTAVVATRQWCAKESTMALLFGYFGTLSVIGGLAVGVLTVFPDVLALDPYLSGGWRTPTQTFWIWTLVQAVGSAMGIVFLTLGYQNGEASYVAVFEYTALVFSAFFSWLIFREVPTAGVMIGLVLITVAGVIIAMRSRQTEVG
ncbi:DMT family transporter [Halocynthiibacter namhaensis]|uniref:DMT family transporter n=1 Tax=Halocynthiibacter namhaensis TaxID=1290553 RepID=UPI00068C6E7D|nr:DMT family transporter [Halocynthiibacter namhaensis]